MSSVALTGRVVSKITDVFSGVPVAFSVVDVASSGCFVDFAETCVTFSLADSGPWVFEVLSLTGLVFPSDSVDVDSDLVVFSLADVASLVCSVVIWTDLSEASVVVWCSAPDAVGVFGVLYEALGVSVEELFLVSSESWEVVGFCEVVLNLVLVSVGLTDFLVVLVRLVEDLHVVLLLGAEVECLPSELFSDLLDLESSAERSFRAIGCFSWLLRFFPEAGGFS